MKKIYYILLLTILFCPVIINACAKKPNDYFIFSDISECSKIEDHISEQIAVKKYNDASVDKWIEDLEYEKFYGVEYTAPEFEFELFAYEFESADTSKKYFTAVTGKDEDRDMNFSSVKGMSTYRLIVIDFEKAYVIVGPKEDEMEILNFIEQIFTVRVK